MRQLDKQRSIELQSTDHSCIPTSRWSEAARSAWSQAFVLRGVLCFLVIPNLIRSAFRTYIGSGSRGTIDLDILLLWPLSIWFSRTVLRNLALGLLAIDFVVRVCFTYYFSPMDLLLAIPAALFLNWRDFVGMAALGLLVFASFYLLFGVVYPGRPRPRLPLVAGVSLLLFGLLAEKTLAGFGPFRTSDVTRESRWDLTTSGVHSGYLLAVNAPSNRNVADAAHPVRRVLSASSPFFTNQPISVGNAREASLSSRPDLLLITVESLGIPNDATMQKALRSLLDTDRIRERFTPQTGTVPFFGATVSGQLRELCQSTIGLHILVDPDLELPTCLPNLLRKQGYETEAIHNGSGRIFKRDEWYPRIGFDRSWFHEQLARQVHLPDCDGPFLGSCDASVAAWVGDRLAAERHVPRFVHWMTLDSHLPIVASQENLHAADCAAYSTTAAAEDVCAWFGSETRTLKSIARLLSRDDLPPVEVIVVGDHAPPFLVLSERLQFSQVNVPFMHFIPRARRSGMDQVVLSSSSPAAATAAKSLQENRN